MGGSLAAGDNLAGNALASVAEGEGHSAILPTLACS
ncbi:MAG: hypothetical protein JWO80_5326, partial [Bryobacterales bacterium]|nr:hypothetical protein [Bryobacterales bacterium]